MDDLIEALQIFRKYVSDKYPTNCEHDTLYVQCDPAVVSAEDKARLDELGFVFCEEDDFFHSYRFGSC